MSEAYIPNEPLDRYIDRFLYAEGWRVTGVVAHADPPRYDVTITKTAAPFQGHSVTRSATSAGDATFKACSGAR
ncbi:MAG TPA: hypothetical protein VD767_05560 [Thermomicrobiales bacterium]|nr:hypothetical protein [Thermomicrobiales bacterium]